MMFLSFQAARKTRRSRKKLISIEQAGSNRVEGGRRR
jgi:hypothetical protein